MVTTLYLIRHGETIGSEVKRYKGSIDVPMSQEGTAQIRKVSAFITGKLELSGIALQKSYLNDVLAVPSLKSRPDVMKLSAVYCSDLIRAVNSAEIIAGPHGLKPLIIPALRERNFGVWEGLSFDEIRECYPAEFEAWASNPLKHSPVNGESTTAVYERVVKALGDIMKRHGAASGGQEGVDNIAIVSHGGVNRIILCHLMGVPLENVFRIEQDHAAVNIIEFWGRYPVVKLVNGGPVG